MKILHVIYDLPNIAGTETLMIDIINQQSKENAVYLMVITDRLHPDLPDTINKNVVVFSLNKTKKGKIYFFKTLIKLYSIVYKLNVDAIHCHSNDLFPFFAIWKKKTFLTVHNVHKPVLYLKYFRRVFAISTAVQEDIKKRCGIDSTIVYNGVEINQYEARSDYAFNPENEFKIVQISRLYLKQKAQDVAIKALSILMQKYPKMKMKLFFVGNGEDLGEIKKMVDSYRLTEKVFFVGQVERSWVKNNLKNYMLLIQPSLYEGFGLTVIEGFASGLPVITSRLDGPQEIINILQAGLLSEPGNPEDLANKIYQVYEQYVSCDIQKTNYLIINKEQLKIFDIATTAQTYLDNYRKYLSN